MKKILALFLIIILTLSLAPSMHADAAAKINKTKATLNVGSKLTLKISGTKSKITWKTDKKAVATVSSKGIVTAKGAGKAKISAKVDNKTFTCAVTVKKNYSGWVQYSTDNIHTLMDGILNGDIVSINGKYYCSPEYFEMISDAVKNYEYDTSVNNAIEKHNLDPDTEIIFEDDRAEKEAAEEAAMEARINAMLKSGAAGGDTENIESGIKKAYEDFIKDWVSETELKDKYQISMDWDWSDKKIYLISDADNKYTLEDVPYTINMKELYTSNGIRYQYAQTTEDSGDNSHIVYKFYFNREDLIAKGIIK